MVQFKYTSYIDQLKVDQAILNVTSVSYDKSLWLYQLSDECNEVIKLQISLKKMTISSLYLTLFME